MSFVLVFVALSALTSLHELGHAWMARRLGMRVSVVSIGFGPAFARLRIRGAWVLLCVIPFGGFVRVEELADDPADPADPAEMVARPSLLPRLAVILAGSLANYLLAALLGVSLAIGWGAETGRIEGLEITATSERATAAGLAVGDVVMRADGTPLDSVETLQGVFAIANGRPVHLEVLRAGAHVGAEATAVGPGRAGLGARYVPKPELVRVGLARAVWSGLVDPVRRTASLARNTYESVRRACGVGGVGGVGREDRAGAAQGASTSARAPSSPIGLATRVSQSGRWDARRVISFVALLTVVVGLFNVLPLPGLDGGRVCIALGEAALGRRLRPRVAFVAQLAGGLALFALGVAFALRDLFGG